MARGSELQSLVSQFVSQLQQVISREVESEISGKFDAFRASVFSGAAPAPRRAGPGRPPKAAAAVAVVAAKGARRSPLAGREAEQKACPVCGKMNKARRFSYLCDDHRTAENRAKFKGTAKGGAPVAAPAPVAAKKTTAAPAKAAKSAGKRGPGRPKGSKNKKKAAAGKSAAPTKSETSSS